MATFGQLLRNFGQLCGVPTSGHTVHDAQLKSLNTQFHQSKITKISFSYGQPRPLLVYFHSHFQCRKNCRLQQDSNSDYPE